MVADNTKEPRHNQGNDYKNTRRRTWETTSFNGQEYFAEEEATEDDDINNYHNEKNDAIMGFTKLLQYSRQLLRLLLSIGRLCDDWRRRPIRGMLHFVQRHEHDLKNVSIRTKTLLFMTCMILLST
eukprot:2549995-Amphidinium_carterae.1